MTNWQVIMVCQNGTIIRDDILFYKIQDAIMEMASEKEDRQMGEIITMLIQ